MNQHVQKDKILFVEKPRLDYSGIAEKGHIEQQPLMRAAESENRALVKSMEEDARKDGKKIVWYCCEYVRDILAGAINLQVRQDDFWGSFVPTFAGLENHTRAAELAGTTVHFNHQFSGYDCKGNGRNSFDAGHIEKVKAGISYHLERLENSRVLLYYIESLLGDIQNSKNIGSFAGMDKYSREIQPLTLWLEKKAEKTRDVVAQNKEIVSAPKENTGRKPKQHRTFQDCFNAPSKSNMELLLSAALSVGLIVMNGDEYNWIDEGAKTHRVCAFWFAALDAGLTKAKLKNNEATTKAIQAFFRMERLTKDTIDKRDPYNGEYKQFKSGLDKKLKGLKTTTG